MPYIECLGFLKILRKLGCGLGPRHYWLGAVAILWAHFFPGCLLSHPEILQETHWRRVDPRFVFV